MAAVVNLSGQVFTFQRAVLYKQGLPLSENICAFHMRQRSGREEQRAIASLPPYGVAAGTAVPFAALRSLLRTLLALQTLLER